MEVKSAGQAIKIAKQIITDAGYSKVRIRNVEYNEDDEIWTIDADAEDDIAIQMTIDAETGEASEFNTD